MRTSTFHAYNSMSDGAIARQLAEWDAEGVPLQEMTHRLRVDHDIAVATETVRRWLRNYVPAALAEDGAA